jgi:hypothetical protein
MSFIAGNTTTISTNDFTGKLQDYWIVYNLLLLKGSVPLFLIAHYFVFPRTPVYPGSLLVDTGLPYEATLILLFSIGLLYIYFVHLVTNCVLFCAMIAYFIMCKQG